MFPLSNENNIPSSIYYLDEILSARNQRNVLYLFSPLILSLKRGQAPFFFKIILTVRSKKQKI